MILLLIHAAATLTMLGVILVVQLVHYPLFRHVGTATYATYQAEHMRRITWIVAPLMTTELVTAAWLVWAPLPDVPLWMAWTGLALVAFIWGTTGLVQVPLHSRLTDGFDATTHRRLVRTNWLRSVAWAARAGLVLWMVGRVVR
jgi:hypothetical protein